MYKLKNYDELSYLINNKNILIVQLGSSSCAPCHSINIKLSSWLVEHHDIYGIYVPIEEFPETAAQLGIFTVPVVLVYMH